MTQLRILHVWLAGAGKSVASPTGPRRAQLGVPQGSGIRNLPTAHYRQGLRSRRESPPGSWGDDSCAHSSTADGDLALSATIASAEEFAREPEGPTQPHGFTASRSLAQPPACDCALPTHETTRRRWKADTSGPRSVEAPGLLSWPQLPDQPDVCEVGGRAGRNCGNPSLAVRDSRTFDVFRQNPLGNSAIPFRFHFELGQSSERSWNRG